MTGLIRYEDACRALAEIRTVDEAKGIRDRSVALAVYARQAKNRDLEADAVEIRMRATRRIDELRQAQKETIGLAFGARGLGTSEAVRGIEKTPHLPSRLRELIKISPSRRGRLGLSPEDNSRKP